MRLSRPVMSAVVLAAMLVAGPTLASDKRIRDVVYDPDAVVTLKTYLGFETMIAFGQGERIQNVAIGDGAAWQITPNRSASLLFVKPVEKAARTNMTVVTDQRSYLFDLSSRAGAEAKTGDVVYLLRFSVPRPPPEPPPALAVQTPAPPEKRNAAYSYTGSRDIIPSAVFDDGQRTYFRWAEGTSTPAVFLLGDDGQESLVESAYRDGYQVVEQLAPRFRLRNGGAVTTVINDAWRPPSPGPDAPKPHDARTAREARDARERAR